MKTIVERFQQNKNKIANVIFYAALSIELFIMMFGHSAFEIPYRGRITHVAFVLFGCKVLLTRYTKKEWIAIILLGVVGVISYLAIDDEWVIRIIMMVIASKDISFKNVAKYVFWISLAGTVCIMLLSFAGIGGQLVDMRDYGRGEIEARWCLGFSHANNVHGTIWYVVSLGLFVYLQKTKWYHYLVLTIGNIGIYMLTLSRGGLIVVQLVIIAALIYRYYPKIAKWQWIYYAGALTTIVCSGLGIYAVAFGVYGNKWLERLSTLLTGRLEMLTWWESLEYWTLFGDGRDRKPTDVGYITLVAEYGYVILALYLLCIFLLIRYEYKNKKWMEFVLLMTCVFYTFMESTYTINVYLLCNFTFLLLIGTWNHLLMKGRHDESVQPEI